MIRLKQFFSLFMSALFVVFSCTYFSFPAYASGSEFNQYFIGRCRILSNDKGSYGSGRIESGSNIYLYRETNCSYQGWNDSLYFVSDAPFTYYSLGYAFNTMDECNNYNGFGSSLQKSKYASVSGTYYGFASSVGNATGNVYGDISFITDLPVVVYDSALGDPWKKSDFVLGSGGMETTNSIVYDSSIPAPQNLRFKSESVGGFLGIGAKFEHELSWSNGLASPPLYARISAVASTQATADDVPFEDSTVSLLSAETTGGYPADTGVYRVGTDEIASKILPGTSLNKVLEYRIQFYRYVDDKLNVGPVATVHLKTNLFGKYDGYTVTTEYPKDPDNIGESGGSDDFYDKDWSSDGQNYQEYDKDGNLIGSGTSEDSGNPVERLLKSLKDIPKIISSTFKAIFDLMSGVGQLPTILSQLFSFLPSEIIIIVGLGITVAIALRIVGR